MQTRQTYVSIIARSTRAIAPAPTDADAAADIAQRFGDSLVDGDFQGAHALLSQALQKKFSVVKVASTVKEMMQDEVAEQASVLNTMHD